MWLVRNKPLLLKHAQGKLFRAGAAALARRLMEHASPDVGCPPFDQWGLQRQLACLDVAARGLLSRGRPTTFPNLWTDAAVAAAMLHVEQAFEGRTHFEPDLAVPWERLVIQAYWQERAPRRSWRRHKSPGCHGVRWLRQQWTTLDWQWCDMPEGWAQEQWTRQGYEVFLQDKYAKTLPHAFFNTPMTEATLTETQPHQAYLLGLTTYGRNRTATAVEPTVAMEQTTRAQRRVML